MRISMRNLRYAAFPLYANRQARVCDLLRPPPDDRLLLTRLGNMRADYTFTPQERISATARSAGVEKISRHKESVPEAGPE